MNIGLAKITSKKELTKDVYEFTLEFKNDAKPGQFINIKTGDNSLLLRRPISIKDSNENEIVITFRVVGAGTKILASKNVGDKLDIIAPLGNGFPLKENKRVLILGGGIGVPPMVGLAKELSKNNDVTIIIGFRDKSQIIYEDELKKYGKLFVTTDDGSYGFKGNILQCIDEHNIDFDVLYACGPSVLLKFTDKKYQGIKEGYISFEERMACGVGVCYGCVCKPKKLENGMLRVCKEGPVFSLGVIDYD